MSRTKNTLRNYIWSNLNTLISALLGFILRTCLIKTLGSTYVGINSLFNNILGALSLAELGIGSAISFSLYKPLAENDIPQIQKLINFYRNAYRTVATVILVLAASIIPFLPKIAKGSQGVEHLTFIYCIYIFNTVISYLITYKSTIFSADQKNYILNNINMLFGLITMVIQIVVLLWSKNYVAYMLVSSVISVIRNIFINIYSGKKYPYIKERNSQKLSRDEKNTIFSKIKSLIYHQVGTVAINQTDSIITSSIINVTMVGYVANYNMVISIIKNVSASFFSVMTPSIGNLIATSDKEKIVNTYKRIEFINFWINSFTSISLFFLLTPFVKIWIGEEYVLGNSLILLLVVNYFVYISRMPMISTRMAAGVFEPDRWSPILESVINLVVSILFAKIFGIVGIYLGTLFSSFVPIIWCPIVVYKYVFEKTPKDYFVRYIVRLIIVFAEGFAMYLLFSYIAFDNLFLNIIFRGFICFIIPNLVIFLLYSKTDNFKYVIGLIKTKFIKRSGT